ncbi:hypothetical protein [Devosia sp.]|uniref:hypothetical protein n=1 Tax=Devosia sp. TaxID=1871048 RepID=UPI003A8F91CE
MRLFGQMIGETLRALAVLALVFLSFGHQPVSVLPDSDTLSLASASISFCGDPVSGEDHVQGPCHACRIAGAALPPPQGGLLHLPRSAPVVESCTAGVAVTPMLPGLPEARGPPRLV